MRFDRIVSFDTAKELKKKGFIPPVEAVIFYQEDGKLYNQFEVVSTPNIVREKGYYSPKLSEVREWLADNYELYIELIIEAKADELDNTVTSEICYRGFIWEVGEKAPEPHDDLGATDYDVMLEFCIEHCLDRLL